MQPYETCVVVKGPMCLKVATDPSASQIRSLFYRNFLLPKAQTQPTPQSA